MSAAPPSPPGRPVVIDISETKCTLRWEPSEDDGGADVKHYIVEYFRDVWEVWLKAKTTKETQVTIDDLIPGSRYKFRIKSENSYGISEPGEESDPFDVGGASSDRFVLDVDSACCDGGNKIKIFFFFDNNFLMH